MLGGEQLAVLGKQHSCSAMQATVQRVFIGVSSMTSANPPFAPAYTAVATQDPQVALAVQWGTLTRAQGP